MAQALTDHEVKLLKCVDYVRWAENDKTNGYDYLMIQRAIQVSNHVIKFELKQAVNHMLAWNYKPPASPPPGPERSPWMDTWDVPREQYDRIKGTFAPDLTQFVPGS